MLIGRPSPSFVNSPRVCARLCFPQILRGQHGLVAAGSGANLGLRGAVERSLRPPPLLHRHPIKSGILQEVLLVVRVRPRLDRPIHATDLPVALPPRATRLRTLGQQPVDFRWRSAGRMARLDSTRITRLPPPSRFHVSSSIHGRGKRKISLSRRSSSSFTNRYVATLQREGGREGGGDVLYACILSLLCPPPCLLPSVFSSRGEEKKGEGRRGIRGSSRIRKTGEGKEEEEEDDRQGIPGSE